MLGTQEHDDLMSQFERDHAVIGMLAEKESKDLWRRGIIYCSGHINGLFLAYRLGYAYGKALHRQQQESNSQPSHPRSSHELPQLLKGKPTWQRTLN